MYSHVFVAFRVPKVDVPSRSMFICTTRQQALKTVAIISDRNNDIFNWNQKSKFEAGRIAYVPFLDHKL